MIGPLKRLWDGFRGSGDAAVTVPPMDGALRPNQLLETARLVAAVPSPDDLASDGRSLFVSSGPRILRLVDGVGTVTAEYGAEITALAASPRGRMAAAVASDHLVVTEPDGASTTIARLGDALAATQVAPLINNLAFLQAALKSEEFASGQYDTTFAEALAKRK